jgi:hypothetical protein
LERAVPIDPEAARERLHIVTKMIEDLRDTRRIEVSWSEKRLDLLRNKASNERLAVFERQCALGQLSVTEHRFDVAKNVLIKNFSDFAFLYPRNGHFFHHILQLALSMQAFGVAAAFLNDFNEAKDVFEIFIDEESRFLGCHRIAVDACSRKCSLGLDPQIIGAEWADHLVARWASSAPLWGSFCDGNDVASGRTILNTLDTAHISGLAYCGNKPQFILVPDGAFLESKGHAQLREKMAAHWKAWEGREAKAFWRGGTTGIRTSPDWRSLPRIALCEKSLQRPDLLDAGISGFAQLRSAAEGAEITEAGLLRGPTPPEGFLNYKYQIDIDGNSNAWAGLIQKLLTGGAVLKVESPHGFRQWYYDRLEPFENYVPVAADMSDLFEKIEWLKSHDGKAREIGENGRALAMSLDYASQLSGSHAKIREAFEKAPA